MPFHNQLGFDELHKAKLDSGLLTNLPATPEGLGDVYWATDANGGLGALFITNQAGDTWVELSVSGSGINFDDLADIDLSGLTDGQGVAYNLGSGFWEPIDLVSSINDLSDVANFTQVKGDIIVSNGTNLNKLAVGSDGQSIVADSTEAIGIRWDTVVFNPDNILTDGNSVLIDINGNVITI